MIKIQLISSWISDKKKTMYSFNLFLFHPIKMLQKAKNILDGKFQVLIQMKRVGFFYYK